MKTKDRLMLKITKTRHKLPVGLYRNIVFICINFCNYLGDDHYP